MFSRSVADQLRGMVPCDVGVSIEVCPRIRGDLRVCILAVRLKEPTAVKRLISLFDEHSNAVDNEAVDRKACAAADLRRRLAEVAKQS